MRAGGPGTRLPSQVSKGDAPPRKLLHFCFYCWPDKGTPTRPTEVLRLLEDFNLNRDLLLEEAGLSLAKDGP